MHYIEAKTAIILVETHLKLWAEHDSSKRSSLLEEIYAEDIRVTDPGIILTGYSEVSSFIGNLLSKNPEFKFSIANPVEVHHDVAILLWNFGPPSQPDKITGQDIFSFKYGRISSLLIFVDGVTAMVNQ